MAVSLYKLGECCISEERIEFYLDLQTFLDLIDDDFALAKFLLLSNDKPSIIKKRIYEDSLDIACKYYANAINEVLELKYSDLKALKMHFYKSKAKYFLTSSYNQEEK